ncbi:ABC transporter ATP-binding protein/permease [Nocardia sp. NPDC051570]|uniref:ABC transporter ATP-binding protein/permease n=1 Tax=Nocardia sp. NPDC051570 TaxID=3364324 RepID=UPI003799EB78
MPTSRDWGDELVASLKWLLIAYSITVVAFVLIAALLFTTTRWGRQFWRLSSAYFTGPGAWRTLGFVAALLFTAVGSVRVTVLLSYQSNDTYTALQDAAEAFAGGKRAALSAAEHAFWFSVFIFAVVVTVHVVRTLVDYYIGQIFEIHWRRWITDRVTTNWLDGHAQYRERFIDATIDNPDQRIQEDITTFVENSRDLSTGAVAAVVTVVSFTSILWNLSGPLTLFGADIPRAMTFVVLIYVLLVSVIAFWIGRPLIRLNFRYQRSSANFRYSLVRVRDNAEGVAFYRGEKNELRGLLSRFGVVLEVYRRLVYRTVGFSGWNLGVSQVSVVLPLIAQAPRFFQGTITLGGLQQTATAFGQIHDSLSFFRENYATFTGYRAALIRLDGLLSAGEQSRALPAVRAEELASALELDHISVSRPDGGLLISELDLRLNPGDALVIKGASGSGKTTLLRTLAGIWPYGTGSVRYPDGNATMFLSQVPYLPLGDLRAVVSYPAEPGDIPDDRLREALTKVHLGHIADRLAEQADWAAILSPGEQQRLAFARVLLTGPRVVLLDEATSAVDEGLEHALYSLLRAEAPEAVVVSVAHRSTVDRFHRERLELGGDGSWALVRSA